MQIIVNPHTIQLNKTETVNEGEYNINTCNFQFSEEYQGLSCVAVFTNGTDTYNQIITNNQCIIPSEVLQNEGTLMLGVYGYEADGDNLIKRYSPTPVTFYIEKGSYNESEQPTPPSPSIVEQLQSQITENANDITTLQDLVNANTESINEINQTLPNLATKDEIPKKVSELQNDSGYITNADVPTKTSDLTNDSGFITKEVNDLENYTPTSNLSSVATSGAYNDLTGTPDLSVYATNQALGTETTNRENADINLQGQIDAITSSSDVKDIVGTYTELQNYDTSTLGNDDIIKVLQDSTHSDAMTYYRWVITSGTGSWNYIGQEGPYYTKSEIDTTLQNYVEDSDLTDYVKNTDYATANKGGVIKANVNGFLLGSTGNPYVSTYTNEQYNNLNNNYFIGKGTLENVLNARIGDISSVLDEIQGEVI
ncbi:MAG: hypothetical protein IKE89_03445 [Bacilli bacterium]|nr:hypothetical protein [Bacilli bacterium]MBR2711506.1 hypothetical protein [Bacilli bacterium]